MGAKCWDKPNNELTEGAVLQKNKEKCTGKNPDANPCMLFIANIYFLVHALEISVFYNLRSRIRIYNAQFSMSKLQAFHDSV